ncbi:kinase-like protein [Polychaeton citri CBS 116435]|uniref:Kinase-like protein n=1 Tax=Polychaeton citri CBS 116435 TaxID=1314669 RepID=A0A9P4UMN3_9PEZI|nr:kinase-like protein [Polychaeton citri CBS 116435]
MAQSDPCDVCSWKKIEPRSFGYKSHVKIFYCVSDHGVWSIGDDVILKERSHKFSSYEARNIRYIQQHTTIPVPEIIHEWVEGDRYYLIMKRIPGVTLEKAWPTMSDTDKECVAKQTAACLAQLRKLTSDRIETLEGEPVQEAFLFDDQLWETLAKELENVPEDLRRRLRRNMPSSQPYTYTHSDLTTCNIMVKDGQLTGIIDWEGSAFFPSWWQSTSLRIGLGPDDFAWKRLLAEYVEPYKEGEDFWANRFRLERYPDLDSQGFEVVERLRIKDL